MKVIIDYTNWKGERSNRTILPTRMYWGSNEWHKEDQWLLEAHDIEKGALRNFALKDIHSWTPVND
jgi:predicted DNA-binding transcriptional regulator YafY